MFAVIIAYLKYGFIRTEKPRKASAVRRHPTKQTAKTKLPKKILDFICPFLNLLYIWTKYDQMTIIKKHTSFGELLRSLREETGQTLKTVAENLQMDTSLLAKIERNERQPTKQIISQVAEYFNVDKKELQSEFLSDQIAYKIMDEEADIEILKVAEEKVKYLKTVNNGK